MGTPLLTMIMHSSWAAMVVLVILLIFSIMTWTIIVNRWHFLRHAGASNRKFRSHYEKLKGLLELEQLEKKILASPLGRLGATGAAEYRRILADTQLYCGKKELLNDLPFFLQSQFAMAAERIEGAYTSIVPTFDRGVFLLAMVSSLSPFLGLLGTVWGIMNSFYEIGNQGSASLPVVAPGIAEALVATLAGLAVAIPALFFYNYFNHGAERIEVELDEFKDVLLSRVKREVLEKFYAERRGSL